MKKILFKEDMIRAILVGKKNQTRRIIKTEKFIYDPEYVETYGYFWFYRNSGRSDVGTIKPRYKKGETVYVGEPFIKLEPNHIINNVKYYYKYDKNYTSLSEESRQEYLKLGYPYKWRSPLFMPESAARIFLNIKDVWIEQIQDISDEDCLKEGTKIPVEWDLTFGFPGNPIDFDTMKKMSKIKLAFKQLWNDINGKRGYPWGLNPNVFAYEFEVRVE